MANRFPTKKYTPVKGPNAGQERTAETIREKTDRHFGRVKKDSGASDVERAYSAGWIAREYGAIAAYNLKNGKPAVTKKPKQDESPKSVKKK